MPEDPLSLTGGLLTTPERYQIGDSSQSASSYSKSGNPASFQARDLLQISGSSPQSGTATTSTSSKKKNETTATLLQEEPLMNINRNNKVRLGQKTYFSDSGNVLGHSPTNIMNGSSTMSSSFPSSSHQSRGKSSQKNNEDMHTSNIR